MAKSIRKIVSSLRNLAALPALMISLAILRILWPTRLVRVVIMEPRFFGHQCLEPEVFWIERQSSIEHNSNDIWLCCLGKRSSAASKVVWDLRRKKFPTVPSWFATSIRFWQEFFDFSQLKIHDADYHRLNGLATTSTSLPPKSSYDLRRREILSLMSDPERPYVIVSAREKTGSNGDLRDRDIRDFEPTILSLIEAGFNVIRLTSRTNNVLQIKSPHLLDWQVRVDGQPEDELVLVSDSSFVVSTTTGIDCLALAYRRPVLYVDVSRLFYVFMGTELATFHLPRMLDSTDGTAIDLEQLLERGLGWVKESQSFSDADVRIVNSTPGELARIVLDYAGAISQKLHQGDNTTHDWWRSLVLQYLRNEVAERHGAIRAYMHPETLRMFH